MQSIFPSARLRPSAFYQQTLDAGVKSFTIYNQMMLPTGYGDPKGEYERLMNGVSMWDVASERQVQLKGPDAANLAQILSPRNLSKCKVGQGKYVPLCDHRGTLINDPILLKVEEDKFWFSIADSNILFWARAIAAERNLNVEITEPDVSPLAIQGPDGENVTASIFGDWIRKLKYFWFQETMLEDIPVAVARSGWSKQGGFEIYLLDGSKGEKLWNIVAEAGRPWGIAAGNPNAIERVESGLLSWGGDTDDFTNPYEVRMGQYVNLDVADDVVGIQALRKIKAEGPKRHQLGVALDHPEALPVPFVWHDIAVDGEKIGDMTNCIWSYKFSRNIGFALVSRKYGAGTEVSVNFDGREIKGQLTELPFDL